MSNKIDWKNKNLVTIRNSFASKGSERHEKKLFLGLSLAISAESVETKIDMMREAQQ